MAVKRRPTQAAVDAAMRDHKLVRCDSGSHGRNGRRVRPGPRGLPPRRIQVRSEVGLGFAVPPFPLPPVPQAHTLGPHFCTQIDREPTGASSAWSSRFNASAAKSFKLIQESAARHTRYCSRTDRNSERVSCAPRSVRLCQGPPVPYRSLAESCTERWKRRGCAVLGTTGMRSNVFSN